MNGWMDGWRNIINQQCTFTHWWGYMTVTLTMNNILPLLDITGLLNITCLIDPWYTTGRSWSVPIHFAPFHPAYSQCAPGLPLLHQQLRVSPVLCCEFKLPQRIQTHRSPWYSPKCPWHPLLRSTASSEGAHPFILSYSLLITGERFSFQSHALITNVIFKFGVSTWHWHPIIYLRMFARPLFLPGCVAVPCIRRGCMQGCVYCAFCSIISTQHSLLATQDVLPPKSFNANWCSYLWPWSHWFYLCILRSTRICILSMHMCTTVLTCSIAWFKAALHCRLHVTEILEVQVRACKSVVLMTIWCTWSMTCFPVLCF